MYRCFDIRLIECPRDCYAMPSIENVKLSAEQDRGERPAVLRVL